MGFFSKKKKQIQFESTPKDTYYCTNNTYFPPKDWNNPPLVPLDELIEAAKVHFKELGFKKVAKRWTKETDCFKLVFYIQASSYNRSDDPVKNYYVRPHIVIKALENEYQKTYGHFCKEVLILSIEQIFSDTERFFAEWTNIEHILEQMKEYQKRLKIGKRGSNSSERLKSADMHVKPEEVIRVFSKIT